MKNTDIITQLSLRGRLKARYFGQVRLALAGGAVAVSMAALPSPGPPVPPLSLPQSRSERSSMNNTDIITHYDSWEIPQRAILAACSRRIGSAVEGQRTPSRNVLAVDSQAARE